jgi:hypothetical protein
MEPLRLDRLGVNDFAQWLMESMWNLEHECVGSLKYARAQLRFWPISGIDVADGVGNVINVDMCRFSDVCNSDWVGDHIRRKSMTGGWGPGRTSEHRVHAHRAAVMRNHPRQNRSRVNWCDGRPFYAGQPKAGQNWFPIAPKSEQSDHTNQSYIKHPTCMPSWKQRK